LCFWRTASVFNDELLVCYISPQTVGQASVACEGVGAFDGAFARPVGLGISRWNNDYNNLLIAKVESELQVAEQYLQRIVGATGTSVEALAASLAIQKAAEKNQLNAFLTSLKNALGLDFLTIVQPAMPRPRNAFWARPFAPVKIGKNRPRSTPTRLDATPRRSVN